MEKVLNLWVGDMNRKHDWWHVVWESIEPTWWLQQRISWIKCPHSHNYYNILFNRSIISLVIVLNFLLFLICKLNFIIDSFHFHVNYLPGLWNPKPQDPFFLAQDGIQASTSDLWWGPIYSWNPQAHIHNKFGYFILIIHLM